MPTVKSVIQLLLRYLLERLLSVYGEENLQMDGLADKVKGGTNFLGL